MLVLYYFLNLRVFHKAFNDEEIPEGVEEDSLTVASLNEETGDFEGVPEEDIVAVDTVGNTITVEVESFSFWAVMDQASVTTAPTAPLLTADFDENNQVGLSDFVLFLDAFGTTSSSPNWNPIFDLDSNGEIGLSDFVIFLDNFGTSG